MKLLPNWKRRPIFLALVVSITLLSGCASQLNKQAFEKYAPRRIGVVIGHDIKAVSTMTIQEEALLGYTVIGLLGFPVLEATAKEYRLNFAQQINDMLRERVIGQMREKGFSVQLLCTNPTKWYLLENISDTADAYANLAKKHNLGSSVNDVDSILFVEYLLEGRLEGRFLETSRLEDLSVENMKPEYSKSKVWLYDVKTGTRLFHNMVQKGYPADSFTSIAEALDALVMVSLESIPAIAK